VQLGLQVFGGSISCVAWRTKVRRDQKINRSKEQSSLYEKVHEQCGMLYGHIVERELCIKHRTYRRLRRCPVRRRHHTSPCPVLGMWCRTWQCADRGDRMSHHTNTRLRSTIIHAQTVTFLRRSNDMHIYEPATVTEPFTLSNSCLFLVLFLFAFLIRLVRLVGRLTTLSAQQ